MEFEVLENETVRLELSLHYKDQYYFNVYDKQNNRVGECNLYLTNDKDVYYLGNIGYEIFSQYQGHHYSRECSKLLIDLASKIGVSNLTITANPDNLPSRKIINSLGAKFIEVVKVPKKCVLYKNGDRFLERYIIETGGKNL